MSLFQSIKPIFFRENIIVLFFCIFMAAFFFSHDQKGHRIIFILLLVIPSLLFYKKNIFTLNKNIAIKFLYALLLLLSTSLFWSSIDNIENVRKPIITILSLFLLIQISYFCFLHQHWEKIIYSFSIFGFIATSISFFYFAQQNNLLDARFSSYLRDNHPNITANYTVLACVFSLYWYDSQIKKTNAHLAFIIVIITFFALSIFLTQSRGGMLTLLVCLSALTLLKNPKLFLSLVLLCSVSLVLFWLFEPAALEKLFIRGTAGRSKIYQILLDRVSGNELLGLGLIASESVVLSATFTAEHSHNTYLATYLHVGAIGLSLHISAILASFFYAFKIYRSSNNWLPFIWLLLGSFSLLTEGTLLTRTYHIEWLQICLPITFMAARYKQLQAG